MATAPKSNGRIRFSGYELDPGTGELFHNGDRARLDGQPLQVLLALLERPGELVTREELQRRLWPKDAFGDFEKGIGKAVLRLRESLHDNPDHPRFVETLPRRGYRFIAPVAQSAGVAPTPPSRRPLLVGAAISLAAITAVSIWLFLANRPAPIASIAVLPFDNLTGDAQYDPEADAFTEALISRLSQVSAFQRVISRTSVMQYKGTKKSLPEIAKTLRVDTIVEGALLQSGDRVKATVRLIHAPRERPIWSQTYDHPARGVIDLQSEMALDLVSKARAALTDQELSRIKSSRKVDPAAYRDFVRGRSLCWIYGPGWTERGRALLNQAIAKEPDFAEAYGALALCGGGTAAIEKALALDPFNSDAYSSRGLEKLSNWEWAAAEADLRRAIEISPSNVQAHSNLAFYLTLMTRFDEAMREIDRALEVSPTEYMLYLYASWSSNHARRNELALEYGKQVLAMSPGTDVPFAQICWANLQLGRTEEAGEACGRVVVRTPLKTSEVNDGWVVPYLVAAGRRKEAEETVAYWVTQLPDKVEPYNVAGMKVALARYDEALDLLETAYELHTFSMIFLKSEILFDPIRDHPRYQAILKKMRFPE
jgi:TolB-like protein/DNA-binding winged helix-turn-helix (wHTH) protein/Tfp pilus assembly protein PilF